MNQLLSRFSFAIIKKQVSEIWPTVGIGLFLSIGGVWITMLVANSTHVAIWKLVKDPAEVIRFQPYIGMLSNWGVILWTMSASICLFGAVVLMRQKAASDTLWFIMVSGALSLFLGIDDLFLLHDRLLPFIFEIEEIFFYLVYIVIFLIYLACFISQILKYDYLLFGLAFLFLVASRHVFFDIAFFDRFIISADALKYFGIVFWLAFFYRTVLNQITTLLGREQQP